MRASGAIYATAAPARDRNRPSAVHCIATGRFLPWRSTAPGFIWSSRRPLQTGSILLDTTPDLFNGMLAVNGRGPFFLMQDAAKLMIRKGIGGPKLLWQRPILGDHQVGSPAQSNRRTAYVGIVAVRDGLRGRGGLRSEPQVAGAAAAKISIIGVACMGSLQLFAAGAARPVYCAVSSFLRAKQPEKRACNNGRDIDFARLCLRGGQLVGFFEDACLVILKAALNCNFLFLPKVNRNEDPSISSLFDDPFHLPEQVHHPFE